MVKKYTKQADRLIPHLLRRMGTNVGNDVAATPGATVSTHALFGGAHTGPLDRTQAPWVASDIATAINNHIGATDPHPQYVHTTIARTITATHNFAHASVGFTSPAADSYFLLGQARMGYDGFHNGDAIFAHRDYADSESYALRQAGVDGDTYLNALSAIHYRIADFDVLRMSAGVIEVDNSSPSTIRTENYASQTTGWALTYDGALDVRYLYADEMHVKAFIADLEQALAGGQIICKSVAKLAVNFLVPNYSSTVLITVESFPGWPNAYVFTTGDTIGIKIVSRTNGTAGTAGSLAIGWLFGTVSSPSIDTANKTQTWILTRLSSALINGFAAGGTAAAGTAVEAGAIVLDFGVSGNGYYEVNAIDGQMAVNSPYSQVVTWAAHPIYDRTVRTREGNLTGLGFSGQYGLFARGADANQYIVASGSGITVRNTTISQYDGSNNLRGQWDTLSGVDLKALGDVSWGLTAGLHDMSISALQNYSFSDSGTIYGGVAGGKGSSLDKVLLYNQQWDVNKEAHTIVDARFINSNNPNTFDKPARVTIAASRWFPGMGVQHSAYIEVLSTSGNLDQITLSADKNYMNGLLGGDWATPTYGSNWADYGGAYGGVRYRKFGDMVMLTGLANTTGAGDAVIATLPAGYIPSVHRVFAVASHYGVIRLDVNSTGTITTPGTSFSGSGQWISLNGVVFFTS